LTPKTISWSRSGFSCVLAFVGISAVNLLLHTDRQLLGDLSPSFGALATLLYAAPGARLSRPRNVLGGNLVGACVGMLCSLAVADASHVWQNMFVPGAAVAVTILVNSLLDCTHPPSGAVALFAALPSFGRSVWYVLTPILLGDVVLLLVAIALNNVVGDPFFRTPVVKRK
jgi:CBS domain-containing membrane protein